jgi:deoxyadenosine/deoxycytidine kinase
MKKEIVIGVVGPCGTGKSELVSRLRAFGYQARHIAQEHSFAPTMWKTVANPDILVYLHVSYPETLKRKGFHWSEVEYKDQLHRLEHARANADVEIDTDQLTPDEVFQACLAEVKG